MSKIKKGDHVKWNWGKGQGEGKVADVQTHKVTKQIKGQTITRNGTKENPTVIIKQSGGKTVMKLNSEVSKD